MSIVTLEKKITGVTEPALARFVRRAREAAGLTGQVHVLVLTNRRMRALNWQFRGKHKTTDVLSFPAIREVAHDFAGDVVISADVAAANARRFHHEIGQEIKVLILHGVLHLAGYNHEKDEGQMAEQEQVLRRRFKLRDGLIERTHRGERAAAPARRRKR